VKVVEPEPKPEPEPEQEPEVDPEEGDENVEDELINDDGEEWDELPEDWDDDDLDEEMLAPYLSG
jgi:hypothetical protein